MNKYVAPASHDVAPHAMKSALLAVIIAASTSAMTVVASEEVAANPQTSGYWQSADSLAMEEYVKVPMPSGFQVVVTELEGPVFADANGRTLYKWPLQNLRNGATGD